MKFVAFAASLAIVTAGLASSANAVGCLSGAVAGGVAGHFVRAGPHHKGHALMGAATGCVAGHVMKEHRKKAAAARAQAGAHPGPAH
jgi:outer membrane lipoprotein SlyB